MIFIFGLFALTNSYFYRRNSILETCFVCPLGTIAVGNRCVPMYYAAFMFNTNQQRPPTAQILRSPMIQTRTTKLPNPKTQPSNPLLKPPGTTTLTVLQIPTGTISKASTIYVVSSSKTGNAKPNTIGNATNKNQPNTSKTQNKGLSQSKSPVQSGSAGNTTNKTQANQSKPTQYKPTTSLIPRNQSQNYNRTTTQPAQNQRNQTQTQVQPTQTPISNLKVQPFQTRAQPAQTQTQKQPAQTPIQVQIQPQQPAQTQTRVQTQQPAQTKQPAQISNQAQQPIQTQATQTQPAQAQTQQNQTQQPSLTQPVVLTQTVQVSQPAQPTQTSIQTQQLTLT